MVEVLVVDPKFEVLWDAQDRGNVFARGFHLLHQDGYQFDVTLFAENKPLFAHRRLLSFYSKHFKKIFDRWPIHKRDLTLAGVSFEALQDILTFIYYGEVRVTKPKMRDFLKAADTLKIKLLQGLEKDVWKGIHDTHPTEFDNNARGDLLFTGFQELYRNGKHFDVTLKVKGDRKLKAHRNVLSICSPYFAALLNVVSANQPTEVVLDNIEYRSMKNLLQYMYTGEVTVDDMVELLLNAGEQLEVVGLERADDLEAERPLADHPKSFRIFARSKIDYDHRQYDKFIKGPDAVGKNVKELPNAPKTDAISDSDSDYKQQSDDRSDESDEEEEEVQVEKPSVSTRRMVSKSKNAQNGRKPNQNVPKHKLKKARKMAKKTRATSAPMKQTRSNCAVKEQNVDIGRINENDEIENEQLVELTQAELEQIVGSDVEQNDVESEKGVDNWRDFESDEWQPQTEFEGETSIKNDHNNNVHQSYVYESDSDEQERTGYMGYGNGDDNGQENEEIEYDFGEQGGAVGGRSSQYGDDVAHRHDDESHADDQTNVGETVARRKGKRGGRKTEDYDVVAEFKMTERGSEQLMHDGHCYHRDRKQSDCQRWVCVKRGSTNKIKCYITAFTKDVNGMTMACFSPSEAHCHPRLY